MISSPSSNHRRHKHWSPQPTPKKRAFGTALPTNSPFPRQRQQQQPKSAKKQLQWTDKKQSASTTAISDVQSSQRKQRSKRKHRNHQSRTGNGSILSTPYRTKTPITGREGTPSVKWSIPEASTRTTLKRSTKKATTPGRVNLFNDFNSPAVPSNVATPGVIRKYDSSHAQKLTYANIAASSPKFGTPTESPVTADADQSYLPTTPQVTELLSVNNPVAASISPSASSVKSNSTTGTSLAVTAMTTDVPETIAPAEYVIEFPPGPLHLKLDSVVYTLGKPMGCCVAKILPEFDSNLTCVRMGSAGERSNAGAAADMIQVNDLIVSINGTNVLSRKFDVITDLLHKLDGSHKTIVLRSIEKVWTSQFERKTMRNLRSGRRVATALSNDQMEHNLHSWVETPTKVEVGRRGNRRSNVATGDKLESISETPTSNNKVHTPKGDADPEVSTDLFSPSNVKKVVSQRSGEIELLLSATPKSSCNKAEIVVGTSEKNYITFADENQGSAVKSSKNSPINQISKALVGDSGSGKEFEQSLRMKKNVLKELNGVCLELGERYFSGEDSPDPDQEVISLEQRVEENTPASIAQTQLEDTDEKVNMLEERVRELTDALASAEDEAREREDELEDQLQQLQSQLSSNNDKSHAEEIRRLEEEKAQAINEVQQQLEKERAFFQERVAKGKRSKQELIGKLGATQSELEKNKALFANLEKKAMSKKEMKAKIKSSSALIQSLQAEKGQLAKEVKSLQKHLSDRDSSEKVKEAELEQKTSELEKMVEQVANLESERDAANEEKQAELESLSSSLTEKAVELEKMVEEVTNLKHHLSLSEKKGSADRVALKANKSKLVEECEQLKAELAESNRVKEDLNAKIDEHETELSRRQNLLDDLKSRNYSLQEMIDDLNETLERSGKDASEQVGFIERKLQTMKQELDDSRSISIQRQDELRQLGEENQTITKQLSKALEELEENRHLLLENDKLSSEHEFLDNRVGKLTESLEKAEHDAREREEFLEKKLEIVKMELDETRSLSNMRHDEIHRLKKEKQNILENAETNYTEFNEQLSAKEEQLSLVRKNTEKDLLALKDELEREQTLKKGLNQKLELIKVDHMASLSRRQELLDDMEKHNSLLKERVLELTDCLAAAEDDARERQDALEEKLEQMKMEVEEAKKSCSRLSLSHAEELKRVEAEKVDALQCMREQMEAECALLKECVVKEEKSKAEVMTELDSLGKHNDLLKQRVTELTDCLAAAEDDAREREDALEEKELQLRGELEEAKVDMKRIQAEYEAVLHDMRREMQVESERFNKRLEIETMSKEKVAAELDTTKHKLVVSEASYAKLECRLQDVQKAMDMEINKLASTLEKSNDDFRQQEDILQGELSKLALKVDEAEVAETQLHEAHKNEIKLIEEEKRAILNENTRFQEHLEGLMNQLELGKNTRNDLESRVESLDKAKAFHEKSLSRRQELLDDMEERNSSLKQRVDELVNCLAKTEDDAREKEDALNERLLQLGSEFETAKSNFNEENVSHIEVVDRLEDEKKSLVSQVSDLSQEKSQLLCQISALRSGNVEMESLLQQVKDSNAASNDEVKELSEKLSSANLDLSRNQTLCEDLKSKLETAERLLDESDAEINTLSYDCDCLEKQVENLNAELETQQQAIATYESQFHSQHNEISLGRSEMESISEDLESQMAKVLLLEDEKSDLSLKIESLTGSLKTVEAEKLQLMSERDALKSISDERHTLLRQLEGNTEIRQSELLDSLAAKEFEISSLKSQRGDLERSLEDLDYRYKQLQNQCEKESKSFENRQDQLLNEISTVNAQNGSYVAQITSLEANMKRIKAELKKEKETHEKTERQLIMDIRNSQNSMSSAKIKQSHVENELQSVKSQLSIRESETSKLIEEKERLETEMRNTLLKADDESKAFAVCRKELDDNVSKLQSDFEKERALCADLTSRLETLNLATNAKQKENEEEKKSLISQVSGLGQEKSQLLCQISALRSGNVELESLLQQVKDSNAASNDEVKELSEKLSSANLDLSRNQTLCEDLKSKLETAERLLDESDAEINTLSYDCDCLEKQVENLNAELETQQQAIATYESQFHSQHNEISLGRSEMESISEDLESQMAKVLLLEDEKSDLSLKIESLTGSLKTVEAEKLQLMSERDALKSISDERHTLLRQLEGNTEIRQSELLDSLAAKEFEISSLKSQRGDLERSLEDLDYRYKQLQNQCEKESKSFENRQDQLLNEISTVNAQNGSYVAQITSLEANMKRIKAELKKEKETHEKTERQLIMDIRNSQNSMSSAKIKQSHVENELQSVKSQLSIRESETSKLIEEKERLETEMRNTLLKADDESKAFAVCRKELDDNVSKLQSDFEKERALCADLTSRLETLNLATNAKQEEIDSLKKEISATNESLRQLQLEDEISKSSFKSQLNDIRSQFEDERQSLKDSISRSEAAVLESQQNFLAEKTSSVGIEAHLNSQLEIIKAELSNAKKAEDDLREQLFDANALLKDKNYEIEELNGDISSEKEGRRQELFETKSLYEKKIQELTTASLDIEAEKSILEAKVERLTQDIAASKARTNELEQLLQRQNEELLKLTGDMSSAKATHETTLSEMEKNYTWNVEELKQLHDTERSELLQQMSEISDELQICEGKLEAQLATQENDKVLLENDKDMIDQLRVQLEEGINLNESLSAQLKGKDQLIEVLRRDLKLSGESLTAVDMKYKAKIDEMKSSYNAEKLHLMEEIEKFSTELDWSLDQIDKRQSIIDSQRLSLNDENNQLIRELSVANDTEMVLRKMLHEAHMEVQQLSIDCNSTRSEIVTALNEARSASEESIQQTAQVIKVAASKWATEKASYEDKIKALQGNISEFSNRDEQFSSQIEELQASLETRDRTVAELSSKLAEITASLEASVGTEVANELASRVDELRTALESRDRHIKELSSQLISKDEQICAANEETQHVSENLECAMSQLDEMIGTNEDLQEEVCKLENLQKQIQSLFATETGDLQTSLDSESNKLVSVTSELDTVILANKELQCKLDKVQSEQNVSFDKFNSEKESLQSRIVSVTSELDTMMLANKKLESELSKLQNEQSLCQDKFESESESLQNRIDTLSRDLGASQDELCQARAHRQEGENSLLTALSNLDDMKLTNELLRDEIVDLKDDLQSCRESLNIEKEKHESRVASLSRELKSSSESFEAEKESFKSEWRHFQLLLKHLVDSIKGKCDVNESDQSSNSKDLPDIASQLGVLIQLVGKKEESILQLKSQIEGLEFDLRDARIVRDRLIHHDQKLEETASAEEDLETSRFLSEIEEAKVKVIGMDRRITTEKSKRKEVEKQLSVERKSLAMIHEELSQKVNNIEELEETVQLNQDEIERLQTQLGKNDEIQNKLERKYEETKSELESYCNLATELKQSIIQKVSFFAKVRWLTSIHFSLTSFSPLIQKNQDIENNESKIMELQFHVDDLQSQVEGWKASLEGLTSEADGWKVTLQNMNKDFEDGGSPNDTSVILSTSFDRNEELSSEIARLEEKMLAMDEEQRLQSSMHKSIVDGLEYRINVLSDESSEAQSYISSLEDSKARLQGKIDMLKKDCDVQCRRLTELESVLDIMKQQKSVSETLCDEVLSGLRKLTEVVIMYSSRLDGFSEELSSPSSWSVNLEYISRVIEFALKLNQKYSLDIQRLETTIDVQINSVGMPVIAEAITPKAKGSGCRSQESRIMPKHLSMIDEIKSMKDALKIVMASPRVTTPAKVTEKSNTDEEEGGDIYSDLLMAYDQLESLSTKLETYQEEQLQWREKETTLQSRIETLEKEKQELEFKAVDPSNAPDDDAKLKETTSEERLMKEKVFRNWALQTQKSKHLNIVKGMTRELNNTREKVQLLKSNLGMDETHQDS